MFYVTFQNKSRGFSSAMASFPFRDIAPLLDSQESQCDRVRSTMCLATSTANYAFQCIKDHLGHKCLGEVFQEQMLEAQESGDFQQLLRRVYREVRSAKGKLEALQIEAKHFNDSCDAFLSEVVALQASEFVSQNDLEVDCTLQQVDASSYSMAMLSIEIKQLSCLETRLEGYLELSNDVSMHIDLVDPLCRAMMPVLKPYEPSAWGQPLIKAIKRRQLRQSWWFWLSCCLCRDSGEA